MTTSNIGETHYPFEFRGRGSEYFKIWIVNVFLSVVTLYIYSAWAKVRTKRYFYGNTFVANSSFEYHAKPVQILKGRIIAIVLLVILAVANTINPVLALALTAIIILLTPWIIWRSMIFNARMSSYRNVRFDFIGKCFPVYAYALLIQFLPLIVGVAIALIFYFAGDFMAIVIPLLIGGLCSFLLYPLVRRLLVGYVLDNSKYGTSQFKSGLTIGNFYKIYLKSISLSIAVYVTIVIVIAILGFGAQAIGLIPDTSMEKLSDLTLVFGNVTLLIGLFLLYVLMLIIGFFLLAYHTSLMRNYLWNNTAIDNRVKLESTVSATSLCLLLTSNFLLIVFTLGLAYPWTQVRSARFYANHTAINADSLDGFLSEQIQYQSSIGEEIGEALDVDIGLGI